MKYTSIGELVGSVIRRSRLKDTSLIADINEWISECMEILRTTVELHPMSAEVSIGFHQGHYPCGMVEIYCVEYNSCQLSYNNDLRDPRARRTKPAYTSTEGDSLHISVITNRTTPYVNQGWDSTTYPWSSLPHHKEHWYKLDGRHVLTSMETAEVIVHGGGVHVDANGFLMIPDIGSYKEAIRRFVGGRIAGVMGDVKLEQLRDAEFETWAGRAVEEITYPSVDKMQATTDRLVTMLPRLNYYDNYID